MKYSFAWLCLLKDFYPPRLISDSRSGLPFPLGTAHTGVTFRIQLQRKRTFYVLNTIIPVVMLSLLNVLVFLLPASSGEKMALAVTVLLSFTVYLSIISEVMPKTSESISILGIMRAGCGDGGGWGGRGGGWG